jgi:CubicO group peptidase (beta-lactamase class C family)
VGAGHRVRLPRAEHGPPGRRGGPADHRPAARRVPGPGGDRPARRGLPHRAGPGALPQIARIQSAISHGGETGGIRLLSPATIERIFDKQSDGVDLALGEHLRFGIGYGLPTPVTTAELPDGRICFWGGWGGSMVVNDLDRRMTFVYVMNKMSPGILGSANSKAYLTSLYSLLR